MFITDSLHDEFYRRTLFRTITQTYKSDKYFSKEQNVMEAVIKNILDDFQWNYQSEITIYVLPKFNNRKIL